LRKYLREHLSLYIFVSVLFLMGVVFGAFMVNALSLDQKQEIMQQLGSFFYGLLDRGSEGGVGMFVDTFVLQAKWLLLVALLGISVIGLPLILVLDFLKGVLIGFSIGYLVGQFSWKGVLFALASIAPQNLILIPLLVVCSVTAVAFSIRLIRTRFMRRSERLDPLQRPWLKITGSTLSFAGLVAAASAIEAFVSPLLMSKVASLLVSP